MKTWFPAATAKDPLASQIESVMGLGVRLEGDGKELGSLDRSQKTTRDDGKTKTHDSISIFKTESQYDPSSST